MKHYSRTFQLDLDYNVNLQIKLEVWFNLIHGDVRYLSL